MNQKIFHYILTYLLFGFSVNNYFINQPKLRYSLIMFSLLVAFFFTVKLNKNIIKSFIIFGSIVFAQVLFGLLPFNNGVFYLLYNALYFIFVPYIFLKIIGYRFFPYLVNIIYFFSIVSIGFWGISNISQDFNDLLYELPSKLGTDPIDTSNELAGRPEQLLIYTYEPNTTYGIIRNPGPFHEPGAFAVFLILGIILNTFLKDSLFNKKNMLFLLALITTASTAGYIAFILFLNAYLFNTATLKASNKYFVLIVSIVLSITIYFNTEFLSEKIVDQYQTQSMYDIESNVSGRFFSARRSLSTILNNPIFGNIAAYDTKNISSSFKGYGFLSLVTEIGLPLFILIMYFFYKTLRVLVQSNRMKPAIIYFAILSLLIVLFAQSFSKTLIILSFSIYSMSFNSITQRKKLLE